MSWIDNLNRDTYATRLVAHWQIKDVAFWVCLSLLVAYTVYIRWPAYPEHYLWLDEAWRASKLRLLATPIDYLMRQGESFGFLYPLEWLSAKIFSVLDNTSGTPLRLSVVFWSAIAVTYAALIFKRGFSTSWGLLVAYLIATAPGLILHGREFKPYTMEIACVMIFIYYTIRVSQNPKSLGQWVIGSTIYGFCTPTASFMYAAGLIYLFLNLKLWRNISGQAIFFILPFLATLALKIFIFDAGGGSASTRSYWGAGYLNSDLSNLGEIGQTLARNFTQYTQFNIQAVVLVIVAFVTISLKKRDHFWSLVLVPFLCVAIASWLHLFPMTDRPVLFIFALFLMCVPYCFYATQSLLPHRLRRTKLYDAAGIVLPIIVVLIWSQSTTLQHGIKSRMQYPSDQGRASLTLLSENVKNDDKLVCNNGGCMVLEFYKPKLKSSILDNMYQQKFKYNKIGKSAQELNKFLDDLLAFSCPEIDKHYLSNQLTVDNSVWIVGSHATGNGDRLSKALDNKGLKHKDHLVLPKQWIIEFFPHCSRKLPRQVNSS